MDDGGKSPHLNPGLLQLVHNSQYVVSPAICRILDDIRGGEFGHPMEIGYRFQHERLATLLTELNTAREVEYRMPWLAALVCCSLFDIADSVKRCSSLNFRVLPRASRPPRKPRTSVTLVSTSRLALPLQHRHALTGERHLAHLGGEQV